MKKIFKILGWIVLSLLVVVVGGLIYFVASFPDVDPAEDIKVEVSADRLKRGEYLANHVAVCMDCHSTRDWGKYSGPLVAGTLGKGGEVFTEELGGIPGTLYAKNITPAGIGEWTDGELLRAFTCGVSKDGRAYFPIMPYPGYNKMTREDAYSIVAYLRTLQPIKNDVPDGSLNFPLNFIVRTIPNKSFPDNAAPNSSDPEEYGKYLITIAGCFDCHTEQVKGEYQMEKSFAGGFKFKFPGGIVRSSNITPDNESGIGTWTEDQFISRFKNLSPDSGNIVNVKPDEFNTPMPWTMYAGMTEKDLASIYAYLRTVKPVMNKVEKWAKK